MTGNSSNEIKPGWTIARLGDLIEMEYGKGLVQEKRRPGVFPVYGSNGVVGHHDQGVTAGTTIVVGRKGSVGEVHFCQTACWPIDTTYFITRFGPFHPRILYHLLKHLPLGELDKSTAIPGLTRDDAYALDVLVPPFAEQQRIVAKVEEVLARVTAARERLAKVPTILKRFRQSVLAAACSGRLTSDWRERNGEVPVNSGMPVGWRESKLGAGLLHLEQGWSPKCENYSSTFDDTWGVIKTTAVQHLGFDGTENKALPNDLRPRPALELKAGDILITRAGPRVRAGVCCYVEQVRPRLIVCDKVYRFRVNRETWMGEFVALCLNEPHRLEEIDDLKTGISDSGVNLTQEKFRSLVLPVPPIEEQALILRRVRQMFELAKKVEAKVVTGTRRADKLVQATLAKAFRGELVPTEAELAEQEDREYETADQLLARIKFGPAAPTPRSRPASPDVEVFRTDLFEDTEDGELGEAQGIARDLAVLRGRWNTPSPTALRFDGALAEAFKKTCNRNSPDRVVADPELHHAFIEQCRKLGLENPEFDLCFSLFNMRKGSDLKGLGSARKPVMGQRRYAAASEIAARVIHWRHGLTVDRIICHPTFVEEFEQVARSITPGYSPFEYRWAALGCRKVGQKAAQGVVDRLRWSDPVSFAALGDLPDAKGVYALRDRQYDADCIFVCGTENIRESIAAQSNLGSQNLFGGGFWRPNPQQLVWTYAKTSAAAADRHGIVNALVSQWSPILNVVRAA